MPNSRCGINKGWFEYLEIVFKQLLSWKAYFEKKPQLPHSTPPPKKTVEKKTEFSIQQDYVSIKDNSVTNFTVWCSGVRRTSEKETNKPFLSKSRQVIDLLSVQWVTFYISSTTAENVIKLVPLDSLFYTFSKYHICIYDNVPPPLMFTDMALNNTFMC